MRGPSGGYTRPCARSARLCARRRRSLARRARRDERAGVILSEHGEPGTSRGVGEERARPRRSGGVRRTSSAQLPRVTRGPALTMEPVRDASGAVVSLAAPPRRIVSLIPSITEILFALGVGDAVAGCTIFCTEPRDGVARKT